MSSEQRTALVGDINKSITSLQAKGRAAPLSSYPAPSQIPAESAACKGLTNSRPKSMALSAQVVRVLAITHQKPWAIYSYDVDRTGKPVNVRLLKSSGFKSIEYDFRSSVESWRYVAPKQAVKGCIAEMRIK